MRPAAHPVVTGTGNALPGARRAADLLAADSLAADLLVASAGAAAGAEPWPPYDRELRFKDRATRLALLAGAAALTEAGLLDEDGALTVPGAEVGAVVSSNLGALDTVCRVAESLGRDGQAGLRAVDLPNACSNAPASNAAIRFGLRGVNLMLCNGATSGLDAVGWAALALTACRARHVLVIGVEPADPVVRRWGGGYGTLDGAAALVMESAEAAEEGARRARAVVRGYARRRGVAAAMASVTAVTAVTACEAAVGLWLPPEGDAGGEEKGRASAEARCPSSGTGHPSSPSVAGPPSAAVHELGRTLPPASGAYGVFQCAVATAWLTAGVPPGAPPTALAAAGGGSADDAAAAVLLAAALNDMARNEEHEGEG
ncbi:beta-ketoacyl synthase N-terminal-like domain-containing protein [Streptomyces roseifaciens]